MELENAVHFLMYNYFKLTFSHGEDKKKVLNACIKRAYSDAAQQGAFHALLKEDTLKKKAKKAQDKSTKTITEALEKLLEHDAVRFENWHHETCNALCDTYKNVCSKNNILFSYGNAQKWVNMSLKYLSMLNEIYKVYRPGCEFCKAYSANIEKYRSEFHVPVDSYIIETVWDEDTILPLKNNWTEKRGAYSSSKITPWSKWTEKEYSEFQNSLSSSGLLTDSPLDWENQAWIEAACTRRKS